MGLVALLVSGRPYDDLVRTARQVGQWDGLVAEDGAVVQAPYESPPTARGCPTAQAVRQRLLSSPGLHPELGQIVASVPRREGVTLRRAVRGLRVRVVANVDRLMVLPAGVNKGAGVQTALRRLGLRRTGYAAIGDAENDLEMLEGAHLSAAVRNALPRVRAAVEYRCRGSFDEGVLEFVRGPLRERVAATRPGPPH